MCFISIMYLVKVHFLSVSVSYPGDLTEPLLYQLYAQLLGLFLNEMKGKTWSDHIYLDFKSIIEHSRN